MPERNRILRTGQGTNSEAFRPVEWFLFVSAGIAFGSAFLLTALALEDMQPGLITTIRAGLGALTLAMLGGTRRRVAREDFGHIVVLAAVWVVIPMTVVPIAQQWIDSAVAGMMAGAMPLAATGLAAWLSRQRPQTHQLAGIAVGFVGVVLISYRSIEQGSTVAVGVVLMVVAVMSYAVAVNVAVPLQQRYGSITVMTRMLLIGALATLPWALLSMDKSMVSMRSGVSVIVLGVFGTAGAYVLMASLIGRAGPARSSFVAYLVPAVALVLGVALLGEQVSSIAVMGVLLVTVGAFLASRRDSESLRR